jgi:hypothetical protein
MTVERQEERDRIADMDQDRQPELAGGRPKGVEPRIVDRDEPTTRVPCFETEALPDLQPACAGGSGVAESERRSLAEVVVEGEPVIVDPGKDDDPLAGGREMLDLGSKVVVPAAVEIDDRLDADGVQDVEELDEGPPEPRTAERRRAEVGVGVEHRERRPIDSVDRSPQHRLRRVFDEAKIAAQPLRPVRAMPRTKYF